MIFHLPVPHSAGGLDFKAGKFVTLEGAETIDPRANIFYSHSYIFNFGIPLNHTGILAIFHPIKGLDLYGGVTRGVNTSLTDNNDSAGFHGGIGLSLLDGALTALATTHIGPENPGNNHDPRYLNDLVVTWKATPKFTTILEANFAEDESVPGTAKLTERRSTLPMRLTIGLLSACAKRFSAMKKDSSSALSPITTTSSTSSAGKRTISIHALTLVPAVSTR